MATADVPADPGAKKTLRSDARARRRAARLALGDAAASALCEACLAALPAFGLAAGAVVGGYWPIGDEADPRPLMEALHGLGFRLALPAVAGAAPLTFRAWTPGQPLVEEPHGTREPPPTAPVLRPDVMLIPLLAFDGDGWRLGRGGGHYDRTLGALRAAGRVLAVGIAFAAQRVAAVPRDGYDQRLDWVVTEEGAWKAP
jgi:5-formyltetrahydrofolate cyclo-ligase